ncbi:hypothetical protein SCHPADRAFT_942544 [Schizopora paradoxa]|uniref:Uncharacterized protein n=1 Tax=Schizopora paradoxa TaxID=27342 RepID=A0A0H2RG54_9AGAM|nr:hypothetical protein SCHPADRAFT_942544 [Schizopora paradoxa]
MADITFDFRDSFQISEGFDIFQNDYNPMSYLNDNEPVYGLEDPVQYVGSESTFLDGQILSDKVINGANNERGSYLAPGSAVSIAPSSSASSLEHNATAEALHVPPSFNGDPRIYDDQGNFTLPSNALLTPPVLSSTSALEHLAQAMDVDSTPFFSSPPSTPDTLEREDDPESDSDSDLESDEAQVESDRDEYEEEIAQITASYRIKPMAQLKDVDVIRSQSSVSRYSSLEPDVESTLSDLDDDETDDAGDLAPPNDIINRPILHPHSRPVAIRGSPTPAASKSFVHAHPEVTPPEDEPILDPESEDDGVDSDYTPSHSSCSNRARKAHARKASRRKATPSSESQNNAPSSSKIVLPAKIVSKKRYKPQRSGGKRRKLTDATASFVNSPDIPRAPRRKRDVSVSAPRPRQSSQSSSSSSIKLLSDFAYAFDFDSVVEITENELAGVKPKRLTASFTTGHPEARYELPSDADWAHNVIELQEMVLTMKWQKSKEISLSMYEQVHANWSARRRKIITQTSGGNNACPFPDCEFKCQQYKDLIKHINAHTPSECFCPGCYKVFGRFDSLDRHFEKSSTCRGAAARFQYHYHRHILSFYYLGFYEKFDICQDIFERLASRPRVFFDKGPKLKFAEKMVKAAKAEADKVQNEDPSSS